MFFARIRWVGRVIEIAGFKIGSREGRALSAALLASSKYLRWMNRQGMGANGKRLVISEAEWALCGALMALNTPDAASRISKALSISEDSAMELLERTRDAAVELAEKEKPRLLPMLSAGT